MIDKKDRQLLALLQDNCDRSLQELAETVGLTPNPCWKRIKRLEQEGYIRGRVALLNKTLLGLDLTAFVMIKTHQHNVKWHQAFVDKIQEFPEVVGFFRTTGEYDYFLQVVVSDIKGYDRFYKNLVRSVEGLCDVTSSFAMEEIKAITQLPLR